MRVSSGSGPHEAIRYLNISSTGVGVAARALQRGAAAEVHHPVRRRGGAAATARALEHEYAGARAARLDRGAGARGAEADDHDVGVRRPSAPRPRARSGAVGPVVRLAAMALSVTFEGTDGYGIS
jgi:hypothetical protein